jgi:predicted GNAT family acetyltransferase
MTQPPVATATARTKDGRRIDLSRDDDLRRYVATIDDVQAAEVEFLLTDSLVVFTHTATEPQFEGQSVASALVRWALDDVREHGRKVRAVCPFVKGYIERHAQEYADLMHSGDDPSANSGAGSESGHGADFLPKG